MRARGAFVMLPSIALITACVLHVTVKADFIDGRLAFRSDQQGDRHWCLDEIKIIDRTSGAVVWHIDQDDAQEQPQFCENDFPLLYGQPPTWLKTVVPARPLASGRIYDIEGWSGNVLGGAFRYEVRQAVTNVAERGAR